MVSRKTKAVRASSHTADNARAATGVAPRAARAVAITAWLVVVALSGACASSPAAYSLGQEEYARGNWDAAMVHYIQALEEDPDNAAYKIALEHAQLRSAEFHLSEARRHWNGGNLDAARLEYEVVLQVNPANQLARREYDRLLSERDSQRTSIPPEKYFETINEAAGGLTEPTLELVTDELFSVSILETSIKDIYRTLARIGGVNILFDEGVENSVTSFEIDSVGFQQALDLLSVTHGHFYKVINQGTLLVIPDSADKRAAYEDVAVRTFYLSNADPQTVAQNLTQILDTASVVESTELNAVTVRDSPGRIATAAEIVRRLDKAPGEVLLDIEILEADRSVLRRYGVSLSEYAATQSLAQGVDEAGNSTGISLNDLRYLNATDWFFQLPSIRYQFMKQDGSFNVMAQPRLRVSEGNDSEFVIGEEVPIVQTTFSTTATAGGNVVPFSTTEYRDVGIVFKVTPRVHHNREVTIELELEISAVSRQVQVTPTLTLPVFTTRRVLTVLRLKEGETNVLAGLLRRDERTSMSGFPGISNLPIVGKLFGANEDEVIQTDVIMSITPHILQASDINPEDLETMRISGQGRLGSLASGGAGVSGATGASGLAAAPSEAAPVQPTRTAQVLITPAQSAATVGQEFSLTVQLNEAQSMSRATVTLTYDPAFLEFVDSSPGTFMASDGNPGSVDISPSGAGRLVFVGARGPNSGGVGGSGQLGTVRFRAIAPGESLIEMSGSLQATDMTMLPAQFWGARVTARQ